MQIKEAREKERVVKEKIRNIMKWISGAIALSILIYVSMSVYIEGNQRKGLESSNQLFSTIAVGAPLPWESKDNKVIAVVSCDDKKIFLKKNDSIGSEISGCKIHLAKDIEIIKSFYKLKPDARLSFIVN